MYVEETGAANPQTVLFLHGGGMAGWAFEPQRHAFADCHCLFVDLPGHGRSEGAFDIGGAAEEVARCIETRAHGGRSILVGHSVGAKVAMELLLHNKELVTKAAICSAAYADSPLMRLLASKTANKLSLSMLKSPAVRRMQARQFRFPTATMEANYLDELSHTTLGSLLAVGNEMLRTSAIPQGLESVDLPVLLVVGGREVREMKRSMQELSARLPHARLAVLAGVQHNYPWANAEAFNALLRDFFCGQKV